MPFDPDNKIVKLCADGMAAEGQGEMEKASNLFIQAWDEAFSDFEKLTLLILLHVIKPVFRTN